MFGGDGDDEEQEEEEGDSGSGYYHNRGYPSGGRAEGAVSAEAAGPTASASEQRRRRLQELESKTFQQVYWVCDAAWPKSHSEQVALCGCVDGCVCVGGSSVVMLVAGVCFSVHGCRHSTACTLYVQRGFVCCVV